MNCLYSLAREDSGSCVTEWIEERKVTRSKRLFVQHTNLHKRNVMSLFLPTRSFGKTLLEQKELWALFGSAHFILLN